MQSALAVHILSVVVWVGGMFFAYMALRPAAMAVLEAPQRLAVWCASFKRFFPWVWFAIVAILASGYSIIFAVYHGFANTPIFVHIMHMLGLLMMVIFAVAYIIPYGKLKKAVAASDWALGTKALGTIRHLIAVNLIMGIITIIVATLGRALF